MTAFPSGTILGYPRIGRRRELKRAVEAHWAGKLDEQSLEQSAAELRRATRERLAALGLGRDDSSIPESFSFYDQVLDTAVAVGALPQRFADLRGADGSIPLSAYFTAARGAGERAPLEMTKWFDTNYHYLVPEIGPETVFSPSSDRFAAQVAEAKADGFTVRPVVVGPVTLLALAKATDAAPDGFSPLDRLDDLLPVYVELLAALRAAGAEWVQLDEHALVSESLDASPAELAEAARRAYAVLGAAEERPSFLVAAGYAQLAPEAWRVLAAAPVATAIDIRNISLPAALEGGARSHTLYLAYIVGGYAHYYGEPLDTALTPEYAARVEELYGTPHSPQEILDGLPADPRKMFTADFLAAADGEGEHWLLTRIGENGLTDWTPKAPVRLYYGSADKDVVPEEALRAEERFRAKGADVIAVNVGEADHEGSLIAAAPLIVAWLEEMEGE